MFIGIFKNPKYSDSRKIAVIFLKIEQCGLTIELCVQIDGVANSVDPDQTAPV